MRYSLVDLQVFIAIADAQSVSRGAQACFLSPSSASLRMKRLEEVLGVPLFVRHAHGVSPTRPGRVVLEHARRCFAELELMHGALAPYAAGVHTNITLFANSSAIASFLPKDLQEFLKENSGARIAMHEHLSHEIVAAVAEGRADLGVVTWDGSHPNLHFLPYQSDELVVVVPSTDPLAGRSSTSFLACLERPFVSLHSGAAIHTFLMKAAAAVGKMLDVRIQVSGFASVVPLVRAGAGISVLPRSVLTDVNCEGISVLTLDEPWALRTLKVCVRDSDESTSPLIQELVRRLTKDGG